MAEQLAVVATWAVGDTHCLLDVTFKDSVTAAAINITGYTPKLRGRGKRQSAVFSPITGTLQTPASGIARFDCAALTATADFYVCQAYLLDGDAEIQTAENDFAIVVKATP